jgi:dihydroxyacetone kinase
VKKIINAAQTVVNELCEGMVKAFPSMFTWDAQNNVIQRATLNKDKVTLISGGGSGHEPAHAGFVGTGMLDAAVAGEVFASPSIMQVYNAIRMTASPKGVLLIIKNYAGDMMNFSEAGDMAVEDDDILVDTVCVNDDVAIENVANRRGVAGTVFVHKIAGALAEEGEPLPEVKRVAEKVILNVRTMGVALNPCMVPAKGVPTFMLEPQEIEMGVGIHGEAGVYRGKMMTAADLAGELVGRIMADLPVKSSDEAALLINGLGGTPLQELFILNNEVRKIIDREGVRVCRTLVGNYMISIDMVGASVSLLKLDEETKRLLDAPAETAAWKTRP